MANKNKKKAAHIVNPGLETGGVPLVPAGTGTIAVAGATTTSASQIAAPLVAPPDLTLPVVSTGFAPVNLKDYRGQFPFAGEVAAVPNAIAELESSTSYVSTFGVAVPAASDIADSLTVAAAWSAQRTALETYLVFVKSNEAVTWKNVHTKLDELDGVFQAIAAHNSAVVAEFPATARLLDVPRVTAQRAASTRARKAKGAKSTATTTAAPAATPAAGGGAGH